MSFMKFQIEASAMSDKAGSETGSLRAVTTVELSSCPPIGSFICFKGTDIGVVEQVVCEADTDKWIVRLKVDRTPAIDQLREGYVILGWEVEAH
jgi:hypothetical protein